MRKLLNSLYILEETAYLTLDGENIVCRAEDSEKFRVPFTNIELFGLFTCAYGQVCRIWHSR